MILSINSFDNWLLLSHNYKSVPHIVKIPILLFYLYWPTTYFWIKTQNENFKFKILDLIHLIPFFYIFLTSYQFYFKSGDLKLKELYSSPAAPSKILILLTYGIIIFYLIITYRVIKKEFDNYKIVLTLFIFNLVYILLLITSYILRYYNISYSVNIYYMRFIIPIILFLSILIILLRETIVKKNLINLKKSDLEEKNNLNEDNLEENNLKNDNLEEKNSLEEDNLEKDNLEKDNLEKDNLEEDNLEEKKNLNKKIKKDKKNQKYKRSRLTEEDSKEYLKRLIEYMEDGEPYRDIDLNLKKISEKLNISNAYISQVLNEYLGENFYTFVNRYRIDLAKEMLKDPKKDYLTILAIAYDSGFKSKGTFNQTFKKITKMTPSAYRKKFSSDNNT